MPTPMSTDARITRFARLVTSGRVGQVDGPVRVGVDLGTANIVMSVVDEAGNPVAGGWQHSTVVRDGIVVDWQGAVRAVASLRDDLSGRLDRPLEAASVAVPPGISPGTVKVFTNVLEAAGLAITEVVDEPVAAARALGVVDGAVIDIGHGTTGVSIIRGGAVALSEDEATGGHHMTLVIAGSMDITHDEAERLKRNPKQRDLAFGLIRPTLEKMATITRGVLDGHDVPQVHLVGGSSSHPRAVEVFEDVLGRPVLRPSDPLFVTPLGIPLPAVTPAEPAPPSKSTRANKPTRASKSTATAKPPRTTSRRRKA